MTPLKGLYVITDSHLMPDDRSLFSAVEAALAGGSRVVQYRDKSTDNIKRLRQASYLNRLCRDNQRIFIVNDDISLAAQCDAHGVHIGQQDAKLTTARDILGNTAIIGVTCHDQQALAQQAYTQGASYIALGAFFPSTTKPNAIPAPMSLLQQVRTEVSCPIVAIGGIRVDNAQPLIDAGADMIAVVHALFTAPSIHQQAHDFTELFNR